jgi:hypothetical protein
MLTTALPQSSCMGNRFCVRASQLAPNGSIASLFQGNGTTRRIRVFRERNRPHSSGPSLRTAWIPFSSSTRVLVSRCDTFIPNVPAFKEPQTESRDLGQIPDLVSGAPLKNQSNLHVRAIVGRPPAGLQ